MGPPGGASEGGGEYWFELPWPRAQPGKKDTRVIFSRGASGGVSGPPGGASEGGGPSSAACPRPPLGGPGWLASPMRPGAAQNGTAPPAPTAVSSSNHSKAAPGGSTRPSRPRRGGRRRASPRCSCPSRSPRRAPRPCRHEHRGCRDGGRATAAGKAASGFGQFGPVLSFPIMLSKLPFSMFKELSFITLVLP